MLPRRLFASCLVPVLLLPLGIGAVVAVVVQAAPPTETPTETPAPARADQSVGNPEPSTQATKSDLGIPPSDDAMPGVGPVRRFEWFEKLWNRRRQVWAGAIAADQGAVVFFGDSITQGWGDQIGKQFDGLKTANRGISGDTTRGMLWRLEQDVLSVNPSAVVMLMGTNDLEDGASPVQIRDNVRLILERIEEHDAELPVVLCRVFPSSASKRRPADKIRQVNALCAAVANDFPSVTVLDTWTLFAGPDGDAKETEFPDLLHPNARGYAKWAAALRPILATIGRIEKHTIALEAEPGFKPLFNGHDLTGWCYRPTSAAMRKSRARWQGNNPDAPAWPIVTERTEFGDRTSTPDGRYAAIGGRLVVTTPTGGRRIQQLWTTRDFDSDFTLRLQFRASPNADSGVFIRGRQLQCRDFTLAGPYKSLEKFNHLGWNDLQITVTGTSAECRCNGEQLESEFRVPAAGPIGLEGDRGQIEYRHVRIKFAGTQSR